MRKTLVAGNWKMNGSRESIQALLDGIKAGIGDVGTTEVAVCPPAVYIAEVASMLEGTGVAVGSQNICDQDSGAFTGEVSGAMLAECGCTYAIVGHSERRSLYGESDVLVAQRFAAAQRNGLTPILCVGELLEERESGQTEAVVARQIDAVLAVTGIEGFSNAVIAYEPVWAIGTGKTATPEQAQEVHAFIRGKLAALNGAVAEAIRIQYGGSMNAGNAAELLGQTDIDGGLIGGASLKPADFLTICKAGG
ncbi:MAG: triose-phosphate isomerase [Gammaproteobacteria bacterium]